MKRSRVWFALAACALVGFSVTSAWAGDPPAEAAKDTVTVYVCATDATVGLSHPGTCPLDDSALVAAQLDLATVDDLGNTSCPVGHSPVDPGSFALYKGDLVRLCCSGCAKAFFARADELVAALEAKRSGGQ